MASSVTWTRGNPESFVAYPSKMLNQLRTRYLRRMEQVLEEAVDDYQLFTATRGTEKSGKPGRIESGKMYDEVSYRVWQDSDGSIHGELGFLDGGELYEFLQTDTGFRHWISGEFIEPTYALRDAALIAMQKLQERRY